MELAFCGVGAVTVAISLPIAAPLFLYDSHYCVFNIFLIALYV